MQKTIGRLIAFFCIFLFFSFGAYLFYSFFKVINQENNQIHAYKTLKQIKEAQLEFKTKNGRYATLADLVSAGLLAPEFAQLQNNGYKLEIRINNGGYET